MCLILHFTLQLNKQPNANSIDSLHRESVKPSGGVSSHDGSISSSLSTSMPIQMMPSAPKIAVGSAPSGNASVAGGEGNTQVLATAASYEAVKRAQELAARMGFHQDPDFAPLINIFPGSFVVDTGGLPPKSTKVPSLRLDAQGREIDEHGNVIDKPKMTNLSTLKVCIYQFLSLIMQ